MRRVQSARTPFTNPFILHLLRFEVSLPLQRVWPVSLFRRCRTFFDSFTTLCDSLFRTPAQSPASRHFVVLGVARIQTRLAFIVPTAAIVAASRSPTAAWPCRIGDEQVRAQSSVLDVRCDGSSTPRNYRELGWVVAAVPSL